LEGLFETIEVEEALGDPIQMDGEEI